MTVPLRCGEKLGEDVRDDDSAVVSFAYCSDHDSTSLRLRVERCPSKGSSAGTGSPDSPEDAHSLPDSGELEGHVQSRRPPTWVWVVILR